MSAEAEAHTRLTSRSVRTFLAVTFALSWGIAALLVAIPEQAEAPFGKMGYTNPHLHRLGSDSPTVVLESGLAGSSLTWTDIQPGFRGAVMASTLRWLEAFHQAPDGASPSLACVLWVRPSGSAPPVTVSVSGSGCMEAGRRWFEWRHG